jgi:hypothetical protein
MREQQRQTDLIGAPLVGKQHSPLARISAQRAFSLTVRITHRDVDLGADAPGSHVLPRPGEVNRS